MASIFVLPNINYEKQIKIKKYVLLLPLLAFGSEQLNVEKELNTDMVLSNCLKDKIETFSKEQTCQNDVNIKAYTFQGDTVLVFNPGNCGADMASEVLNFNCERLGLLGGITGNTIISDEDFSNAVLQETIWEK